MAQKKIIKSRKEYELSIQVTTSTNPEHSSFDFETTVDEQHHFIKCAQRMGLDYKFVYIFRNQKTFEVRFQEREDLKVEPYNYKTEDLLGVFEIRYINRSIILRFHEIQDILTDRNFRQNNTKTMNNKYNHHIYAIVRSFTNEKHESEGFKLCEGSLLKIGQKEYFVTSICTQFNGKEKFREKIFIIGKSINNSERIVVVDENPQKGECKYCMVEEGEEEGQFLCTPCKCSGSCALVHFNCLEKWNKSKVKIEKVKGVTYYNFQKFSCEVCQQEYPTLIIKKGRKYELMPIEFPKGQHLILEEIQLKNAALIVIEEIPETGIRMGRGQQCQIKIDSPSISRNHAIINKKHGQYYIYDSKSKFGTTVRQDKIYLQLDMNKKGIQIDRTVIMMQLVKKLHLQ